SSEDARPDELTFDAPQPGRPVLLYFQSAMTQVTVPAEVGVTAVFAQDGKDIGKARVSGNIETFGDVVLRVLLEAA
ncbi:MAG TPA: hypothetical protein VFT22_36750, partial [Kofleriaceae bacterium]|nr:hypothetical protein [Kofleriaceae bacterium]